MTRYLAGIHDIQGAHIVPPGGWVLDVVSIAARQSPVNYNEVAPGRNIIVRLSWGFGSTGNIPLPAGYSDFAQECAAYVQGSKGCTRWIIGNEPNHSQEWPAGQVITPAQYADCFQKCRAAIKRVQPDAEVIPAPVAPWNVEAGDWIAYQRNVWDRVEADALAVHSYIHEADPNLVNSDQTMDPPFEDRLFQFNAYRDLLFAVPDKFRHLPIYLTEANPLSGWQARGIIPAMLDNVNWWNEQPGMQPIQCVIFYRYPDYDEWGMESKGDVIAEFKQNATRHTSPEPRRAVEPTPSPVEPAPTLQWDERLDQRGAKLVRAVEGEIVYRLVEARWLNEQESGGRHHIFVDVLDEAGMRMSGVYVSMFWPTGGNRKRTDTGKADDHGVDFPMFNRAPAYGIRVEGLSDEVQGLGLGSISAPHHNIHTSYRFVFQRVRQGETVLIPDVSSGNAGLIKYVTAPAGLNVRSAPRMDAKVTDKLPHGTPVRVVDVFGVWQKIGLDAWVHGKWLSDTKPEPVPVPVEPGQPITVEPGNVDPRVLQAILNVESGGNAVGPGGRVIIRFENHIFLQRHAAHELFRHGTPSWTKHEWRRNTNEAWRPVHTGAQAAEWEVYEFAASLNREAASESISMGAPQIMGFHFRKFGYASATAMLQAFRNPQTQIVAFFVFLLNTRGLLAAIQQKNWREIARLYNGAGNVDSASAKYRAAYDRLRN